MRNEEKRRRGEEEKRRTLWIVKVFELEGENDVFGDFLSFEEEEKFVLEEVFVAATARKGERRRRHRCGRGFSSPSSSPRLSSARCEKNDLLPSIFFVFLSSFFCVVKKDLKSKDKEKGIRDHLLDQKGDKEKVIRDHLLDEKRDKEKGIRDHLLDRKSEDKEKGIRDHLLDRKIGRAHV